MELSQINELTKVAYDITSVKYDKHFRNEIEQKEYDRLLLDKFSNMLPENSLICDAGCGPSGQIGKYLFTKGHRVTGIDISPKCIDIAASLNPMMDYMLMDMMNTRFQDSSFDGIISFYSIIYTPKIYVHGIFTEFKRILKPGGKLFVVVKKGIEEGIIDDDWYEGNKVYFTHFLEKEIEDLFVHNDFRIDFIETRKPYDFEFKIERIFIIGTKI